MTVYSIGKLKRECDYIVTTHCTLTCSGVVMLKLLIARGCAIVVSPGFARIAHQSLGTHSHVQAENRYLAHVQYT